MSWGTELFDQFDNICLHTLRGIDFCDRFTSFLKERCVIENDYACRLKKLVKSYQPKKKEDAEFTCLKGFVDMINELNDIAGQHEFIAENISTQILSDLQQLITAIRHDRKKYIQDGTKQIGSLQSQLAELEKAKKQYEKAHKEAERSLENFRKADADIHLSRADVDKAKNLSLTRQRACDDSKKAYAAELQKTNTAQHEHYHSLMPKVFDNLQQMEENRVNKVKEHIQKVADIERKTIPIVNTCIAGIVTAADLVSATEDTRLTIEKLKSGFLMPSDIPFEEQDTSGFNGNHSGVTGSSSEATGSPTASTVRGRSRSTTRMDSIRGSVSGGSGRSKKRAVLFNLFTKDEEAKEDYSHLPPNQQKKKLAEKVDTLRSALAKQTAARDGLLKMQDVFSKNPKMGDPASLAAQLDENSQVLDKLQMEIRKFEGFITDAENRSLQPDSLSGSNSSLSISTTSQQSVVQPSPIQTPNHDKKSSSRVERSESNTSTVSSRSDSLVVSAGGISASLSPHQNTSGDQHDSFDNEDYDDEVISSEAMQPIGTCIALYAFDAPSEGSIPMKAGEDFFILESDQGDGWTRVRRRTDGEEGFVPTSYVRCHPNTSV